MGLLFRYLNRKKLELEQQAAYVKRYEDIREDQEVILGQGILSASAGQSLGHAVANPCFAIEIQYTQIIKAH